MSEISVMTNFTTQYIRNIKHKNSIYYFEPILESELSGSRTGTGHRGSDFSIPGTAGSGTVVGSTVGTLGMTSNEVKMRHDV